MKVRYETEAWAYNSSVWIWLKDRLAIDPVHHNECGPSVVQLEGLVTWDLGGVEIYRTEDLSYWGRVSNETKT